MNYAMTNYSGVPIENFSSSTGSSFRIFDKPKENRLMITSSISAALGGGAVRGATFGAVNTLNSEVVYRQAAEEYLKSGGRNCTLTSISFIIDTQYEVRYNCEIKGE